jgi:hypothetical protein
MSRGSRAVARSAKPAPAGSSPTRSGAALPSAAILAALVALLLVQYHDVFRLPFLFDDYTILQKVRGRSLPELWMPRELLYGWYRPWSRETHFWLHAHLFGLRPVFYHLTGFALAVACLALFHAIVRRLAGARAATIAAVGLAVFGGWSGTLLWAAGAQESWMVLFALGSLGAFLARRSAWASVLLAGALLSKETAIVLPAIALAAVLIERETPGAIVRRVAPLAAITAAWALLHPTLLDHASEAGARAAPASATLRTLLSLANLEHTPNPENGWGDALSAALPSLAVIGLVMFAVARVAIERPALGKRPPLASGRVALLGLAWLVLAALPPIASGSSWAAYYGVLAACGAWLAAGVLLAQRPLAATAVLLAVTILQAAQSRTPVFEWGAASYQRRAATLTTGLERSLRAAHPSLPAHTRIYLEFVPQGFGAGEKWFEPVAEVWYRDTTLAVQRLSQYRVRSPGDAAGPDLFFGYAPPASWLEFHGGPEDLIEAPRQNPYWADDHRQLALTLGRAGDWRGAAMEVEKLAQVFPADPQYGDNLALCLLRSGESAAAAVWQRRADSLRAARGTAAR